MKRTLKSVIFLIFAASCITEAVCSQESRSEQISPAEETFTLYPETVDTLPDIPSPHRTADGMEIVIAFMRDKKYALVPVTRENGAPYRYAVSGAGKGKQLEVDAEDFPTLAETGLHSEEELKRTKTITGKPVEDITEIGRPGGASGEGFMSRDEDLISVLIGDNRLVQKLGLTHPDMAKALFHLWNLILEQRAAYDAGIRPWGDVEYFLYNGKKVFLEVRSTKGWQESIFNDNVTGGYHINFWRDPDERERAFLSKSYADLDEAQREDLANMLSHIHIGEIQPYYVMWYGFYEGHTGYRADPVAMAFIFGLRSLEEIVTAFKGNLYDTLKGHFTPETIRRVDAKQIKTFVFECGNDFSFTARVEGEKAWLFLPEETVCLPHVPSASGLKYSDGKTSFWTKGEEAALKFGDKFYRSCMNNRREAVWEDAKLRGVDFRAVGNEPGWHLEISRGNEIVFVTDYGEARYEFIALPPVEDKENRSTVYKIKDDVHTMTITLEARACRDTMSDDDYQTTVTILFDGKEYRGCGNPLH